VFFTPEGTTDALKRPKVCGPSGAVAELKDTSRVKDLSVGGLFIETRKACPVGATVELHFLVQDGEIRANATVRYVKAGSGLGLQFETVRGEDQARFATMVKRLMQSESPANSATKVLT
jgi:hypothetical protein